MQVVVSKKTDKKNRIYHRVSCIYANRIKPENRKDMSLEKAQRYHYRECKCCSGLQGDIREHKKIIPKWEQKYNMQFIYEKKEDTLFISTEVGFWKVYLKEGLEKYLLYHRNYYSKDMNHKTACSGEFHRQTDVKATHSLTKLVEYITKHDRAKVIIMEDYRKLPHSTKEQKKYYRAAERKAQKKASRRLDALFAALEDGNSELRSYSFC